MKKKKSLLNLVLAVLIIAGAITLLVRHFHIKDFRIIKDEVLYISDQPRGMDYTRLLYNHHITTIVNVRDESEHLEINWRNEEINWTKNNGVNYIELPINRKDYFPDKQTQQRFIEIMSEKKNLPVLLHGSGDDKRVAMLMAVWLKTQGWTSEEVLKTIHKIIDDRKLTDAEKKFIENPAD